MASILMIIAPENFRDEEYFEPKKVFEKAGFTVATASSVPGESKGSRGGTANAELSTHDIDPGKHAAVVLVGGNGAREYFEDEDVHEILRRFHDQGKPTAAICISPNTLANAGLLEGKRATAWNDEEIVSNIKEHGGKYTGLAVTVDGFIVTANGPEAASEFAREIVELIKEQGGT